MGWIPWAIGGLAIVIVLVICYAALWVGAGCDAHLNMAEHERRCRK